ncbi:hypothetical protein MKW92_039534 [Papaver armeniacum]|nr:hypothetical protein MKW92_039534 [Papaver armeniacum]
MEEETSTSSSSDDQKFDTGSWIIAQDLLKRRLILEDNFTWKIPTTTTKSSSQFSVKEDDDNNTELIRYVGGVDLSFSKDDSSIACASIVVLDLLHFNNGGCFEVVYEDYKLVHLQIPYIPGFLAFREAPVLLELLEKMKRQCSPFYPQVNEFLFIYF